MDVSPCMNKASYNTQVERAGVLRETGKTAEAMDLLTRLSEEEPQWPAASLVMGKILWDMGRLEDASVVFDRAIQASPKLEIASLGKFHTLWEAKRHEEALSEIRRFQNISFSSDYQDILENLQEKG